MLPDWFYHLGVIGWPLAACSIVGFAICLERLVFLSRNRARTAHHYQQLKALLNEYKVQPKLLRDEAAAIALNVIKQPYYSGLKGLRIISTISPMLGLLGTILGIITAFKAIAAQAGPVAPHMIAEGLWEAMLTTAIGLMIALPALLMAHLFKHLSDQKLDDICHKLNQYSLKIELEKNTHQNQAAVNHNIQRQAA